MDILETLAIQLGNGFGKILPNDTLESKKNEEPWKTWIKSFIREKSILIFFFSKNLNIKAGLTGIAWRVRVESGLPERHPSPSIAL